MYAASPRVILRLCLMFWLQSCGLCLNMTFNFGHWTSDLSDRVCSGDDIILNASLASDLQCSYSCATDVTCGSFFYHNDNKRCVTCDDVFIDGSSLVPYLGMSCYIPEKVIASIRRWNEWTSWSLCSVTCNQGTRSRNRTCINTDNRCKGNSSQTENCNMFICDPIAKTCAEWATRGFSETREIVIDPDGGNTTFNNVNVFCDLNSEPGKAITVLHHDNEELYGFQGVKCGSGETVITYTVGFEAAKRIVDISSACRQHVQWKCHRSTSDWTGTIRDCVAWKNRSLIRSSYLTGPYLSGKYCNCGDQGTCLNSSLECNCDKTGPLISLDEGDITLKTDLPIHSITGGDSGKNEDAGAHIIGPVLCW